MPGCANALPGIFIHFTRKHMNTNKQDDNLKNTTQEEVKREGQKSAFVNGQSPESVKKNPNPRANENLADKKEPATEEDTTGVGSEITDGEDG